VLTLVLAGLDAFNPCAFFVLLFLLSMMAHQKSRTRMLAIGGVFAVISGLMYFAFMAAWLNVFQLFGHLAWVTLAAGALAVFVGAVNVKDFFAFEQGLTLSIPDSKKPGIFRRTRAILAAENLPAMLAATVVLAIAANFYELLCTAGFPMVYTRLLTLAELSPAGRYTAACHAA
jgi:cytochrome c biogenesis protein CcdA